MKKILIFILTLLCLTGCGVGRRTYSQTFEMGAYTYAYNYEIFQTLSEHLCLAHKSSGPTIAIHVEDVEQFGTLYDGKPINNAFVMIDTYTYTTVKGDVKTIPLVIPEKEYDKIAGQEEMEEIPKPMIWIPAASIGLILGVWALNNEENKN